MSLGSAVVRHVKDTDPCQLEYITINVGGMGPVGGGNVTWQFQDQNTSWLNILQKHGHIQLDHTFGTRRSATVGLQLCTNQLDPSHSPFQLTLLMETNAGAHMIQVVPFALSFYVDAAANATTSIGWIVGRDVIEGGVITIAVQARDRDGEFLIYVAQLICISRCIGCRH